jgi:CheY-like chemotaxis protein
MQYLKAILKPTKIKTISAENGLEAVEKVREEGQNIHLILMDINLPLMNGYDATRKIKKLQPEINIIAQTAYAMQGEKHKCIQAGCDNYISKPVKTDKLFSLMAKYLSEKKKVMI